MAKPVTDEGILKHIRDLVDEEHRLRNAQEKAADEHERLEKLQVELDQCWDLLRQRKAREEFGQDPDGAEVRPPGIVEKYTG